MLWDKLEEETQEEIHDSNHEGHEYENIYFQHRCSFMRHGIQHSGTIDPYALH